jgi:membrane-associated protease RseP (regulator of RpoE activity)
VEPDESQLQRSRLLTRLRIFSAGSFANFLIAAVVLGLMAFVIWPAVANPGVVVESVSVGSPAAQAGMQAGMVLSEINGKPITSTYWEFMGGKGYFADELGTVSVGTKMNFVSGGEQYLLTAAENPETKGPYIGITYKPIMKLPITEFFSFGSLVTMIWLFSFAVGMVNILPLFPLDGGLMFDAVAKKFIAKKRAVLVTRIVTYFLVLVLVFDFLGPWLISLVKGLLGL